MFNGKMYKTQALQRLKGNWKVTLLAALVIVAAGYVSTLPFAEEYADDASLRYGLHFDLTSLFALLPLAIQGIVAMAEANFFVRFFKDKEAVTFSTFIEGLNLWLKGILASLWVALWTALWSFLFIIPGIVKAYSYSQIYFVLAEHPTLSVRKAMELSKVMTRGYKGNLFGQDLGFLGWGILCFLTGGLGLILLLPYYLGAKIHAYAFLKEQALATGILKESDFSNTY